MDLERGVSKFAYSVVAVVLALLVGAVLIWASGYDVKEAYSNLFTGAFGGVYSLATTIVMSTPLLFTGLSVAFAFQCGLFNVGAEGQLYVGALTSAVVALALGWLPPVLRVGIALLAGAGAGALLGFVPGYLKAKLGAHEVITTIMLNYVATFLTTFLVKTYFKDPGPVDQTVLLPMGSRLPELIRGTRVSLGIVLGIVAVALLNHVMRRSVLGYEIQVVGQNPHAAEYGGVNVSARTVQAMMISGAVAGLAGSVEVMGTLYRFIPYFSPGYGFTGIAVAVIAGQNLWAVIPAAILFGALQSGGQTMQLFAGIPMELMTMVQGLVILFVAAPTLGRLLFGLKMRVREGGGRK
ncbi:MAG TPA: ABC transporter permease [Bacillota bacterium]|nr:ABC transporter permease [Bacillota bacterium]